MAKSKSKEKTNKHGVSNTDVNLLDNLSVFDQRYNGDEAILGLTALTYPSNTDSNRLIMHASHEQQRVVLNDTEFPKVFTNYEQIIGKYSSYNNTAKHNLTVYRVINKFDKFNTDIQPAVIFVYDEVDDKFDVITKKDVENLTEKYGFRYDNSNINNIKEGDVINEGDTISRPTSFDKFGNYGFGRNLTFMYLIDNDTIEDAIKVSSKLDEPLTSYEVEQIKVTINDNDAPINLYGDSEHYRSFPDIGERIKNKQLLCKRRINLNQLLFDFSDVNTQHQLPSDVTTYADGIIVDIDIYSNNHNIKNIKYNEQLIEYIDMSKRYYTSIVKTCEEILTTGSKVSDNIKVLHKRARQLIDDSLIVKDDNKSAFSNIVMYFTIKRPIGIQIGQKLTGRYGNKGVISVKSDNMPVVDMGNGIYKEVDVILNALGVMGRLVGFTLMEQSINFITRSVVNRMITLDGESEISALGITDKVISIKEELLFDIINIFNEDQAKKIKAAYNKTCKTLMQKIEYFKIVQTHGIFINIKPLWHSKNVYNCIRECYTKYDFIKPYDVWFYNETSDRYVKMIMPQIVGDMYFMKLKQTAKKGLSVRSTGPISKKGIPEKKASNSAKNLDPYPKTAIRFGIQELLNQLAMFNENDIAEQHLLYRSSVIGRRELATTLMTNYGEPNNVKITDKMTNRNVEILTAYFQLLGFELLFEHDEIDLSDGDGLKHHIYRGKHYVCSTDDMKKVIAKDISTRLIDEQDPDAVYIGSDENYQNFVNELIDKVSDNIERYID